jgi:hypothetical protein
LPPDLFFGVSAKLDDILNEIDAGLPDGNRYTHATNVIDRAAWCVIEKHCPGKGEGPARLIIKTWIESALLVVKDYDNPKTRKPVKGLWVDEKKRPK